MKTENPQLKYLSVEISSICKEVLNRVHKKWDYCTLQLDMVHSKYFSRKLWTDLFIWFFLNAIFFIIVTVLDLCCALMQIFRKE